VVKQRLYFPTAIDFTNVGGIVQGAFKGVAMSEKPVFIHDGGGCRFVGVDRTGPIPVDMYVCNGSIIRRRSNEPSDYESVPRTILALLGSQMPEHYKRVVDAAKDKGLWDVAA